MGYYSMNLPLYTWRSLNVDWHAVDVLQNNELLWTQDECNSGFIIQICLFVYASTHLFLSLSHTVPTIKYMMWGETSISSQLRRTCFNKMTHIYIIHHLFSFHLLPSPPKKRKKNCLILRAPASSLIKILYWFFHT